MNKRFCYYIPESGYVQGQGWRVSIVTEGEAGHTPTGTWPYHGKSGETMPWFWGEDFEKARALARQMNLERLGLTDADVDKIVTSSIATQMRAKS